MNTIVKELYKLKLFRVFVIAIFAMTSLLATATAIYTATDNGTNVEAASSGQLCYITLVNGSGNQGIKVQDNKAKITVNVTGPKGCTVPVTLALWDAKNPSGLPLSAQKLSDSKTKVYGPGTYTMGIPIPECTNYQVDLLYQKNPKSVVNGNANYQLPADKLANFKLGTTNCPPPPPTPPTDVCPNIAGIQSQVPAGYVKDASGNCVPPPSLDVCPNIAGMQSEVPAGYVKDSSGNCVIETTETDVCPNIAGMQTEVPDGYVKDSNGNCVIETTDTDVCPNIEGMQTDVPAGYERDQDGNCVLKTKATPAPVQAVGKGGPLPDTGPGDIAGLFLATSFAGSLAYKFVWLKRFI